MQLDQETVVAKRDLVAECGCQQCCQGKQRYWKMWMNSGNKEEYQKAKRLYKLSSYLAKFQAKQEVPKDPSPGSTDLFCIDNKIRHKTWIPKARNLFAMTLESCSWTTASCLEGALWAPLKCKFRLGPRLPHRSLPQMCTILPNS